MRCSKYPVYVIRRQGIPCGEIVGREGEVLLLLLQGYANARIGRELYLSEKTVRNYVSILIGKFGAENRLQLALMVTATDFAVCLGNGRNVPQSRDICQMERKKKVGRMKEKNEGEVNRMLEELTVEEMELEGGTPWLVELVGGGLGVAAAFGVAATAPISVPMVVGVLAGGFMAGYNFNAGLAGMTYYFTGGSSGYNW